MLALHKSRENERTINSKLLSLAETQQVDPRVS